MNRERSIKPLVIALVVSVSLNMFGAGVLAATRYAKRDRGDRAHPHFALGPHGFLSRAGVKDDPALRKVLESRRRKLQGERGALMQARGDVRAALATEPFEREKLASALGALRGHVDAMQMEMHEALLDLAQTLPAPERKRLADAPWLLGAEGSHGPRMGHGMGGGMGGGMGPGGHKPM